MIFNMLSFPQKLNILKWSVFSEWKNRFLNWRPPLKIHLFPEDGSICRFQTWNYRISGISPSLFRAFRPGFRPGGRPRRGLGPFRACNRHHPEHVVRKERGEYLRLRLEQDGVELVPVHDLVEDLERVAYLWNLFKSVVQVEKAELVHKKLVL